MISLRQKLYESLLDDEEDLIEDNTIILKDDDSEFYKHFERSNRTEKAFIQGDALIFPGRNAEVDTDGTGVNFYFDNIDTIKVENGNLIYRNEKTVSPETLCKNIIASNTSFLSTDGARDVNITAERTYFGSDKLIKLNNVHFNFTNANPMASAHDLSINIEAGLPEFHNVTMNTNSAKLELEDNGLGQKKTKITKWIEKFMDLTYTFKVNTIRGEEELKSDLKSLMKIFNRSNVKYNTDKVFKLKNNNTRISDIFPNFPKEFKTITIQGWTLKIIFFHPDTLNEYTPIIRGSFINSIYANQLSDGWIMQIIKY